ncbi:hypothetical protein HYW53_03060 [Candidatus Giovannonibacteria bacterium]|nr:hypothetical protein [Candidatus Giovannonibacteria bacterium]
MRTARQEGVGGRNAEPSERIEKRPAPPPALLGAEASQKVSQNQKCRENFFAGWRALASGGGAASFVGGFLKMRSDFVQGMEPNCMIRVHRLGASPLGGHISKNFPRLFGFKANRLRAQNVVRRAKRGVNGNLQPILFLPPSAESKAIIFSPKAI